MFQSVEISIWRRLSFTMLFGFLLETCDIPNVQYIEFLLTSQIDIFFPDQHTTGSMGFRSPVRVRNIGPPVGPWLQCCQLAFRTNHHFHQLFSRGSRCSFWQSYAFVASHGVCGKWLSHSYANIVKYFYFIWTIFLGSLNQLFYC